MAKKQTKRGQRRAERAVQKKARQEQVAQQYSERANRARTKKGALRAAYKAGKKFPDARPGDYEQIVSQFIEKRVYRWKGVAGFEAAVDLLTELRDDRPKWKTYVQIGDGYHDGAKWVGSRVESPQESSVWLQGVGEKYLKKGGPFGGKKKSQLWVEVVALRRLTESRANAIAEAARKALPKSKKAKAKKRRK